MDTDLDRATQQILDAILNEGCDSLTRRERKVMEMVAWCIIDGHCIRRIAESGEIKSLKNGEPLTEARIGQIGKKACRKMADQGCIRYPNPGERWVKPFTEAIRRHSPSA